MSQNDTIASEALAAAVGGAVSSGVLYPLEVLKTRMQADDVTEGEKENNDDDEEDTGDEETSDDNNKTSSSVTAVDYARNLYRNEGMGVFFDGMEVSAFQSAIEKALYFFAYTALKRGYARARTRGQNNKNHKLSAVASVLLGCIAEWVHLPVTLPIDALTTAIQTSGGLKSDKMDGQKTQDVLALWMILWKEKSFYKGIEAYWILCFKPALQYAIFEQLKAWKLRLKRGDGRSSSQLSAGEAFLLGMFSRTVATLAVFPFVRAKVRMQSLARAPSDPKAEGSSPSLGSPATIWKLLAENYSSGGLKALYQGLGPELTRGVLSAALMMMVKERISGGVKKILHSR
mmetsp:Transcript_14256/g.29489  ORF Transcript_14256/g.29489 Transcript_14256/m.29489 type:complete len:345 (+) Transcript_14256:156-1190(+)